MTDTPATSPDPTDPDPIDLEAAEIDARSPEAAEQIEELIEHAETDGRHPHQPIGPDDA